MSRVLPDSPNLEHLKKEAKSVLRDALHGDTAALERFRRIGSFSAANPATLADAQHLLAKEYGFENWSSLKAAVVARIGCFTGHDQRNHERRITKHEARVGKRATNNE